MTMQLSKLAMILLSMISCQLHAFVIMQPVSPPLPSSQIQDASHIKNIRSLTRSLGILNAVQINRVTNVNSAAEITDFFVTNFWDQPITKTKQKEQLMSEVYKDLTQRYINAKSGKSALLVAKDGGRIVGCVGIETRGIREGQVTKYEPITRNSAPIVEVRPVIANLAVDRSIRRKGIGAKILTECEKVAKGWGYDELWLLVDEKNKPAKTLYEKSGYELVTRDPRGTKVVPTEWQLMELSVTNLCMRKLIKATAGSSFSLFAMFQQR